MFIHFKLDVPRVPTSLEVDIQCGFFFLVEMLGIEPGASYSGHFLIAALLLGKYVLVTISTPIDHLKIILSVNNYLRLLML